MHSLEHGRVVFWYRPDATPELAGQLKSLYDEDNYHVIVAPNPRDMPSQVAASSWTRTLTSDRVERQDLGRAAGRSATATGIRRPSAFRSPRLRTIRCI